MFWLSRCTYSELPGLGPAAGAASGSTTRKASARSAKGAPRSRCPPVTGTRVYAASGMSEKVGRLAEVHLGKPGLPRGPHRLPPARVRRVQRERLVRAAL